MLSVDAEASFALQIDPIFVLLPCLERSRARTADSPGRFCSFEQLVTSDCEAANWLQVMSSCKAEGRLRNVCDVKEVRPPACLPASPACLRLGWIHPSGRSAETRICA